MLTTEKGAVEWVIVAWSDWDHQVVRAFERMDNGDRAEIGEFPEGRTNGGAASTEAPDASSR